MRLRRLVTEHLLVRLLDLRAHLIRHLGLGRQTGDASAVSSTGGRLSSSSRSATMALMVFCIWKNAASACSSSSPKASCTTFLNASLSSAAVRCATQPSTFSMNSG